MNLQADLVVPTTPRLASDVWTTARGDVRLASRVRRGWSAAVVLPWLVVPLLVAVVYRLLPSATEMRAHYQGAAVALVTAPALAYLLTRTSRWAHHTAGALVAAVLPGLSLISLHGTGWFFSGPFGDQSFRLEYATRFAADLGSLQDYTYQDAPSFYSPGWFWVVGLVARVTGTPAWHAYKWVGIATLYVAVAVAFLLWRRTCSTRLSAALVTVTVIGLPFAGSGWLGGETLMFSGGYEPYGWLVVLPLPALLSWFAARSGPFQLRRALLLGVAIAAAAWLYLLYAVVAVVAVLVIAALRRRERSVFLEVLAAGLVTVVLVSPWLGPFVVAWLEAGRPHALATTYVQNDSYVSLITPAASPWVVLALVGAVAVLAARRWHGPGLLGCQAVGGALAVLGLGQVFLGQSGAGVLFHRMLIVLGVTLLAAGVFGAQKVLASLPEGSFGRLGPRLTSGSVLMALLTVAVFIGVNGHAREWVNGDADLVKLAHDVAQPDGEISPLSSPETRAAIAGRPSLDQLAEAAEGVAARAGQPETGVVLTDDEALLATSPFFGYIQWWELYSSPLGEYPERRAFLEQLASEPADQLASALRAEPDAPTVFVLEVDGTDVTFGSAAWDGSSGSSSPWTVRLPVSAFSTDDFVTTRVDGRLIAALREG